jgi:aryl-alcohol dehydrogenase-like predicted oxidoreductase
VETIAIGSSGLSAPRIALGAWAIGGWMWGGTDEAQAIATIQAAIDRGVSMIDTAPVYGFGRSEEIVGRALEGRRDRALIATKCGLEWSTGAPRRDSRPERIERELEDSLARLRTDRIDLYQVHWPDPETPIAETARALERMYTSGKIRAIGVSNFGPAQMHELRAVAPLHAVQPPYNLFERAIDGDVLPYAKEHELAVLAYGPLCRGLLTGRIDETTTFEGDDLRNSDPKFADRSRRVQYVSAVRALDAYARERFGKSVLALAVRWVLDRGPTVALWGGRRPEQLDPIEDVFGWSLDEDAMRDIDAIVAREVSDPVGPEFMAPPLR